MKEEIISNEKEIQKIIKNFETVNQNMKNIYCDETNFSPIYILKNDSAMYIRDDAIPAYLYYNFDEFLINTKIKFKVLVNSKNFYSFLKTFKKEINKIVINESSIKFYYDKDFFNELCDTNWKSYELEQNEKRFLKYKENDVILDIENVNPDIIKDITEHTKDIEKYYIDFDNKKIIKEKDDDLDLLPIQLNNKFLNGIYYKIKHLKSGDVSDYSNIGVQVYNTTIENFYMIKLIVMTKFGSLEHFFIICDY
jgi:hypothetical protein